MYFFCTIFFCFIYMRNVSRDSFMTEVSLIIIIKIYYISFLKKMCVTHNCFLLLRFWYSGFYNWKVFFLLIYCSQNSRFNRFGYYIKVRETEREKCKVHFLWVEKNDTVFTDSCKDTVFMWEIMQSYKVFSGYFAIWTCDI